MPEASFFLALYCVAVSIVSLFFPVLTYTAEKYPGLLPPRSAGTRYSILDMLEGERFSREVLAYYTGRVWWHIDGKTVAVFACVFIAAIVLALAGIFGMKKQTPTRIRFAAMIAGMIGICIPAAMVFAAAGLSIHNYEGRIYVGAPACIIPVAMLICIILVTAEYRKQKRIQEQLKKNGTLLMAGDL